jgi:hypothetical protein
MRLRTYAVAFLLVVVVLVSLLLLSVQKTDQNYNENVAIIHATSLTSACRAYYLSPRSGGTYPAKLMDLIEPPFGGSSFVDGGDKNKLISCWGQPYKYAVIPNEQGEPEFYVWAEHVVDGELRIHGAKRTAAGAAVRIGGP